MLAQKTTTLAADRGTVISKPVTSAWRRLDEAKGLHPLSLSARVPGQRTMETVVNGVERRLAFEEERPGEPLTAVHAEVYRRRPDVGAVVVARPHWASALNLAPGPVPGLFDEQVRQLGRRIDRLSGLSQLEDRHCAYLWGDGVLCLGVTLERAVFNLELLEKCAEAYLLAAATGLRVFSVPWWVREIAFRRLKKDQARAAHAWARGVKPEGFTAY
jgi:hypothetical protein